ncbi:MAG TPA: DUF4232 domain-containing protein [Planosporangium sp.]|nr:DUF4232 domain-containing protein [Planosporangium sp.]
MNQDDELAPRFNKFSLTAAAAGALTAAVLAAGGTWFGLRLAGSSGPPAASIGTDVATSATPVSAVSPTSADPGQGAGAAGPGTPAGGNAPAAGASSGQPGRCHTGDLDGRIDQSAGGAAAGSVYLDLGLTNHSSRPCRIYGFPGMSLVDSAGRWLPTKLSRDAVGPASIRLAPGQTAWAVIHYAHLPADDETFPCQPAAVGLVVTPPDETTQLSVKAKLDDVCQHGQMGTSPMRTERSK